jgi:uncharacterized repeat protein (TIGR01451 family)
MKKVYYYTLMVLSLFAAEQSTAQFRPFTPRYINASVRGNIKFVSNNIITTANTTTSEAPPGGTATNNNDAGVNIDIEAPPPTTFFNASDPWKYLDNGSNQGTAWFATGFSDATWKTGNGKFGYGDAATTVVYSGCGASNYPAAENPAPVCGTKYITTYFRKTINIPDPTIFAAFRMNVRRDDGIVIYVNGAEVLRDNMPTGTIAFNTLATAAAADDGATVNAFTIPSSAFVANNNVIAVEIHQNGASSTDLSFDMQLLGLPPDSTFNSSSSNLNLASCSEVLWAGLYWGASLGNSANTTWRVGYDTILLKVPGSASYAKVVSAQTDLHENGVGSNHNGYTSYANVTSLINTLNANGTYTVANMVGPVSTGLNNQAGGWTLVVAFKNNTEIPRNLVVFDGFSIVSSGTQNDFPIGGFTTPLTGPVSCELGAVCYDGDRGSNDGFFFKQDSVVAGTYTDLTPNGTSNLNDMWNSTISYLGANVTTRNPAHANTLGYDADIVQLPNGGNTVLGNNRTSARIRISSPSSGGENFFLQVVTSAISVSNPSFTLIKSSTDLNGGSWLPGDSLRYSLINRNNGVDTSTSTVLIDTLPGTVIYKPNSISINGILKTDAAGDDEAEYDATARRIVVRLGTGATAGIGGNIIPNRADTVTFTVNATTSCQILGCNNIASNQAHVTYIGKNSGQSLSDHSGYVDGGGCFVEAPLINAITGGCSMLRDTTLINQCPLLVVTLPASHYYGFTFYSAMPFIPANQFNPATSIGTPGIYYAYYNAGAGCSDTVRFNVLHQLCPDLDDDDDGIPDLVESGNIDAYADANSDGILNFTDPAFPGFIDINNDGINDNFDTDLDGVPNQSDIDSDNDGIPDVVEAGGVDANGDGRIDNFTDTDADGLSQNVDANNTGAAGSGNGLGEPGGVRDTDGDGLADYRDLDSDGDGIPDVIEAGGTDANNDGHLDNYTDLDADGFADSVDGDPNNDGTADNSANALLRTGADINTDGRADSYPFRNMDNDAKPNPYDIDSDGDGLVDVKEAGLPDLNNDGRADGAVGFNGWSTTLDALPTLTLLNTDGSGNADYIDIDSDNDGIPDNVEGQSTSSYILPSAVDTDGDGLDNAYDIVAGFGGGGNTPNDQDGDTVPDYRDLDTDSDGSLDIVEGNDLNANCMNDDNVTLTGVDNDGDGLDDRFDADNGSGKGTAAFMGTSGSLTGDASPGSLTHVQRCSGYSTERDWRLMPYLLDVNFLGIQVSLVNQTASVRWTVTCDKIIDHFDIERSLDGIRFSKIGVQNGSGAICNATPFAASDNNINNLNNIVYYRVKAISKDGSAKTSTVAALNLKKRTSVAVLPNPASQFTKVLVTTPHATPVVINIVDATGKRIQQQVQQLIAGDNNVTVTAVSSLPVGIYMVQVVVNNEVFNQRLVIQR